MHYKGFLFKNKKPDFTKLESYGFACKNGVYKFKTDILDGLFEFVVTIDKNASIDTKILEKSTNEEYQLVYVQNATGEFVGKVKNEYEKTLTDISEKCFVIDVFKSDYANEIIRYIKEKYNANPEYLWEKFPDNAVFRNQSTNKWFAAILTTTRKAIGRNEDGKIEIIDLKAPPEEIQQLVDGKNYLPGYHMNKKHWFTIPLDGTVEIKTILKLIDNSYKTIIQKRKIKK